MLPSKPKSATFRNKSYGDPQLIPEVRELFMKENRFLRSLPGYVKAGSHSLLTWRVTFLRPESGSELVLGQEAFLSGDSNLMIQAK